MSDLGEQTSKRHRWLVPLALAVLSALAYANAAPRALVFDDAIVIAENPTWGGVSTIPRLFRQHARAGTPDGSRLYRPVAMATLALDHTLYRGSPRGYHLSSIAWHLGATLVLFGLLLALGLPRGAAFVAALVFGVHPIHTEVVNQAFNRSEILATIGVLGGLWWLLRHAAARPVLAYAGASLIYLLALLSRESAVTFPALAALMLVVMRPAGCVRAEARRLAPLLVLLVPLGVYLLLRQAALAEPGGGIARSITEHLGEREGLNDRLPLVAVTVRDYLRMLVWPHPLRLSYADYEVHGVALALLLHVVLLGAAVALRRRAPAVTWGVGFFYLALLPSTKLFADPALLAERFVYLPSAGACLPLACGLAALARRWGPRALILLGVALTVALAPLTLLRNLDYHSRRALWEAEGRATSRNWQVLLNLCRVYLDAGEVARALDSCDRGVRLAPRAHWFHTDRGVALVALGRLDEAERAFQEALRVQGGAREHYNLARLHLLRGHRDLAEAQYHQAISKETRPAARHALRGDRLWRCRGDAARARVELDAALRLEPGNQLAQKALREIARAPAAGP